LAKSIHERKYKMLELSLALILSPIKYPVLVAKNPYADGIPYECLYKENKRNKNILEYNTITTEDLVKEQNQEILERLNEHLQHNRQNNLQ